MASTSQLRAWYEQYLCADELMVRWAFPGDGRVWELLVAPPTVPVWEAFAWAMSDTGYLFRESAGGTYNCRVIAGTDDYSLHSYGLAIDINPSKNPYGSPLRHNYPPAFIAAAEGITCLNGVKAITWGGRWGTPDAMHWQINASPADIATGISGAPIGPGQPEEGTDMRSLRLAVVEAGSKGWLPQQKDIDYWLEMADTQPNSPEWQDFEDMWAIETQKEWQAAQR